MKRCELYRVYKSSARDPKKYRMFVVVSCQILIESRFSTVICAPIYTRYDGLSTQVRLGTEDGLKHESAIHCDELVSIPKTSLTNFVATLSAKKIEELNVALQIATGCKDEIKEIV